MSLITRDQYMHPEVLVRLSKVWKRPLIRASTGKWVITPSLNDITLNRGSREGYWLMTYIGPDWPRGRHEEAGST